MKKKPRRRRITPSRKKVLDLIHGYKEHPILWCKYHPLHKKKKHREKHWDKLLIEYKEVYPDVTKQQIKIQLRHLRQYHNREKLRLEKMNELSGGEEQAQSSLYYYDEFDFLNKSLKSSFPWRRKSTVKAVAENNSSSEKNIFPKTKPRFIAPKRGVVERKPTSNSLLKDDSDIKFGSYVVEGLRDMTPEQNLVVKDYMSTLIRLGKTNQLSENMAILLKPAETSIFIVEKNN